jgi:outer membrane protein assembly factor BamB
VRRSPFVAAVVVVAVGALLAIPVSPPALGATGAPVVTGNSPSYDWAGFHHNSSLAGYASNSPLSTANASQLGVAWATNLYGAALDSPIVYYDPALGETLDYIGTEHGDLIAVDAANGSIVWSRWLGAPLRDTPVVYDDSIYVGTYDSSIIFALNATTGAVECSRPTTGQIESSPLVATPPGGVRTVYFGTLDNASASGPLLAINAATCAVEWSFTDYATVAGSWAPLSYGIDATGQPLVLVGTDDPDSTVYAVNAMTGVEAWRFTPSQPAGDYDVGAGATISAPGTNGFTGGVAYVTTKFGIMWAVNLTTGAEIWSYNFDQALGITPGTELSTAALAGTNLLFGYDGGLVALNAVTGVPRWSDENPADATVDSSPAIAGSGGSQVVIVGDLAGGVDVVSLATGASVYHYQTGSYIAASPAVSDGNIVVASSDGFLYDFAIGGGNGTSLPTTTITAPLESSTVVNPDGNLTVTGSAADSAGVAAVMVAVQESGPEGLWWDAATGKWVSGPDGIAAVVDAPGATSSGWRFSFPVPPAGGTYAVTAYAVSSAGLPDITGARSSFAVLAGSAEPYLAAAPAFVAPGSNVTVMGGGFADSESIDISLLGETLATTTSTATGTIPTTSVPIPLSAAFGQTSLIATGQRSRETTAAAITIADNWDQLGYSGTHAGFEPNDNIFYNSIHPGASIFLSTAWRYQFGAPIDTAPAVADGVAYVGNTAGQLVEVDVHNGAPLWTWNLPSGAAIAGSPAVDPAKGLVFVGADDGTLDAVSTATGELAWAAPIGGDVSAPVYGGGEVYVTSSTGTVEALAESTGKKSWAVTLPSAISAAPSLDTVAGVLVVGTSAGDLTALALSTGATSWTYSSGGAVRAPAMISGGTVYFASGDSVKAVSETTGASVWSYQTHGPIADSPAQTYGPGGNELLIGSDDGNIYDLEKSNGSLVWDLPIGEPVIGVATVHSVVIYDTSSGIIGAARSEERPEYMWQFQTAGSLNSPPAIVDAAVYVGAGDWNLYGFTTYGYQPG